VSPTGGEPPKQPDRAGALFPTFALNFRGFRTEM
jgi:hypothetical protein